MPRKLFESIADAQKKGTPTVESYIGAIRLYGDTMSDIELAPEVVVVGPDIEM